VTRVISYLTPIIHLITLIISDRIKKQLAPCGTDDRLFATDVSAKFKVDTKTRTKTKIPA